MRKIPLNNGKFVVIDDDDFERVSRYKWSFNIGYAQSNIGGKPTFMHRLIMGADRGILVDHRDFNGLNNQKNNLRFATHSQNTRYARPSKGRPHPHKGIVWVKPRKAWSARLNILGKTCEIAEFSSMESAAAAYNVAARIVAGDFALLNTVSDDAYSDEVIHKVMARLACVGKNRVDNVSGWRGVSFTKANGLWTSCIYLDGQNIHLGRYRDKDEAAYVRDQVALQLYGDKVQLNILIP